MYVGNNLLMLKNLNLREMFSHNHSWSQQYQLVKDFVNGLFRKRKYFNHWGDHKLPRYVTVFGP